MVKNLIIMVDSNTLKFVSDTAQVEQLISSFKMPAPVI